MPSKVFIIEDHAYLREALEELIGKTDGLELCGSSGEPEEALKQVVLLEPSLVLIDISLPRINGLEVLRELQKNRPQVFCVMLSAHRTNDFVHRARHGGARGYVAKSDLGDLGHILRQILEGHQVFPCYD